MVTHDEEDLGAFAGERWRVVDGRLARLTAGA
jgi:hypothetical protein